VLPIDLSNDKLVGAVELAFKARPVPPPVRSLVRALVGQVRAWLALEMPGEAGVGFEGGKRRVSWQSICGSLGGQLPHMNSSYSFLISFFSISRLIVG